MNETNFNVAAYQEVVDEACPEHRVQRAAAATLRRWLSGIGVRF